MYIIYLTNMLDEADRRILRALQDDGRLTLRQLANLVHLTSTPVYERVKRLEAAGVIRGYHAQISAIEAGLGFTVFCYIKLAKINTEIHQDFATHIADIPEITECYNISGAWDYLLKICVPDMAAYRGLVTDVIGRIPQLASLESVFVMDEVKHNTGIPI